MRRDFPKKEFFREKFHQQVLNSIIDSFDILLLFICLSLIPSTRTYFFRLVKKITYPSYH